MLPFGWSLNDRSLLRILSTISFYFFSMKTLGLLLVATLAISGCYGVDRNNFKSCDQSGFCKRLRAIKPDKSQYSLNLDTVIVHGNVLSAEVVTIDLESEKKTVLVRVAALNHLHLFL